MDFSLCFGTRNHTRTQFKAVRDPGYRYWVIGWRWFILKVGVYSRVC